MRRFILLSALAFATAACGGGASEDKQTTETRMDDLDSLEGTISDDAINSDESTDEAPFEPGSTASPTDKADQSNDKLDKAQPTEPGAPDIIKGESEAPSE